MGIFVLFLDDGDKIFHCLHHDQAICIPMLERTSLKSVVIFPLAGHALYPVVTIAYFLPCLFGPVSVCVLCRQGLPMMCKVWNLN